MLPTVEEDVQSNFNFVEQLRNWERDATDQDKHRARMSSTGRSSDTGSDFLNQMRLEAEQRATNAEQRATNAEQLRQEAERLTREAMQYTREAEQGTRQAEQRMRLAEQRAREAQQREREAVQRAGEAEQLKGEAEQSVREAQQREREAVQRAREAEQLKGEAEQSVREAEKSVREAVQRAREAEQLKGEAEQRAREAEQRARAAERGQKLAFGLLAVSIVAFLAKVCASPRRPSPYGGLQPVRGVQCMHEVARDCASSKGNELTLLLEQPAHVAALPPIWLLSPSPHPHITPQPSPGCLACLSWRRRRLWRPQWRQLDWLLNQLPCSRVTQMARDSVS